MESLRSNPPEPKQWNIILISGTVRPVEQSPVNFDPNALALQYYFGDLQYWKIPGICIEALEHGFDGHALRGLSGLMNPAESDIRQEEIDSAFREMGVNAPIPKEEARLVLATDAAKRALAGETNLFNEADPYPNTHLRIARSSARIAAYCCSFREVKTRRKLAMATRKAGP